MEVEDFIEIVKDYLLYNCLFEENTTELRNRVAYFVTELASVYFDDVDVCVNSPEGQTQVITYFETRPNLGEQSTEHSITFNLDADGITGRESVTKSF